MDIKTISKIHLGLDLSQKLQFVRVSGLRDQTLTDKINKRLRSAPEDVLNGFQEDLADSDYLLSEEDIRSTSTLSSRATVGLRGPRLLTVQYRFATDGGELGRIPMLTQLSLVVDLRTGDELDAGKLLSPRVRTPEGAEDFTRLLARFGPGGRLCEVAPEDVRSFLPEDIIPGKPDDKTVVDLFPTPEGITFTLGLWKLGYPMVCNGVPITVDYTSLAGLLGPALEGR